MEMLCRKLEGEVRTAKEQTDKYNDWASRKYEDPPVPKRGDGDDDAAGAMFFFVLIGLGGWFVPIIGPIITLVSALVFVINFFDYRESVRKADKIYNEALKAHANRIDENRRLRENIPVWRETARKWEEAERINKKRLRDAERIRADLYSVNVIPSRYRTIHAAYFLYDYFESGRETDLDKIIQTMLLDEIVRKMDKLIEQNSEILLNQRMMLAQQERRERDDHNRHLEQMRQIARLEQNQQRQLDNQNMIARNQQVTNFFLEADYLRKR